MTYMNETTISIIGGGVVGLAISSELSKKYDDVLLLERHAGFGQETSSRNSEVIHSGIYYEPNSLKAVLCAEGASRLYRLCEEFHIPYRKTGKLIVAEDKSDAVLLEALLRRGTNNNVQNLRMLDRGEAKKIEPSVRAYQAIYSPDTGIIDTHSLMKHFYNRARSQGVLFAFNSEVTQIRPEKDGYVVAVRQGDDRIKSKIIINAAGLFSDSVAGMTGIDIDNCGYRLAYCKGVYFCYGKSSPVKTLIYPVPYQSLTGLGVHATLDLGSKLKFGPDAEYVSALDYNVDMGKRDLFYDSASRIILGLDRDAFTPDMAGIRPKLRRRDERPRDFVISEESQKGLPGLINLIGIESPGLTACAAIACMVGKMVGEVLN